MTDNNIVNDKPMYGIWIKGTGWLRGKDVFADYSLDKARQVAFLIGNGARVRFIDESIIDLERQYLEQENRSIWKQLTTKLSTLNSRK